MTRCTMAGTVGTTEPFPTAARPRLHCLWEAGDSAGMATLPLTCGDVGFSTIHSTYYCS